MLRAGVRPHPRVERITFTGATATGRKVMGAAAENLTFTTLELGGKNALIVLDDADIHGGRIAIEGMFYNQGEACTSTSRLLVHLPMKSSGPIRRRRREPRRRRRLNASTDIGPLVDEGQQQRVLGYIRAA